MTIAVFLLLEQKSIPFCSFKRAHPRTGEKTKQKVAEGNYIEYSHTTFVLATRILCYSQTLRIQ